MPYSLHRERHAPPNHTIRDLIIGMSDGLTVPFAIAAGLASATVSTHIIITAGLAEIAAGSISMGLGGYLAMKSDAERYEAERLREEREVRDIPEEETHEIKTIFESYGLSEKESTPLVRVLQSRKHDWVDFMMKFELGLEKPDARQAIRSGITIGGAYIVGGLIPLSPYFFAATATEGLATSVYIGIVALVFFGYGKSRVTAIRPLRSTAQTVVIGVLAAAAAFVLAKIV